MARREITPDSNRPLLAVLAGLSMQTPIRWLSRQLSDGPLFHAYQHGTSQLPPLLHAGNRSDLFSAQCLREQCVGWTLTITQLPLAGFDGIREGTMAVISALSADSVRSGPLVQEPSAVLQLLFNIWD